MLGSLVVYVGLVVAAAGSVLVIKPIARLGVPNRVAALAIVGAGFLLTGIALVAPASESHVNVPRTRLDEFTPVWQFNEYHSITIAAPPARVFEAIRRVRADEIFLFRTLTWIRRGGRSLPQNILNAGDREPLIDVAVRGGFVRLADDEPRELVLGAIVVAPPGARGVATTSEAFRTTLAPGFAVAAMNFIVSPDASAPNASVVSTETRVFANSPSARRRFAGYWRVIYPGSALIRRSWLRAIERRATSPNVQ